MGLVVEYYFAPQSPWSYLGHDRLAAIARRASAEVRVLPVDLGRVFPVSGGLPLSKRAPQRQSYRLTELQRFGEHLQLPINVQPRFFPVNADDAAKLVIAVEERDGNQAAMSVAGALMKCVWVEQRNIADPAVLQAVAAACGIAPRRLEDSQSQAVHERYERDSQGAIDAGVFGAPTYVIDGEMFWGQDRLDFVERRLARG